MVSADQKSRHISVRTLASPNLLVFRDMRLDVVSTDFHLDLFLIRVHTRISFSDVESGLQLHRCNMCRHFSGSAN